MLSLLDDNFSSVLHSEEKPSCEPHDGFNEKNWLNYIVVEAKNDVTAIGNFTHTSLSALFNFFFDILEQAAAKTMADSDTVKDVPYGILQQEVEEQYTLFGFLQHYLQSPQLLNSPMFSSLSDQQKEELLEQ